MQGSAWQLTHCFLLVTLSSIPHTLQHGTVPPHLGMVLSPDPAR